MVRAHGKGKEVEISYLTTWNNLITKVEHVDDKLRHHAPPKPKENGLAILDEEKTVFLETL